MISVWNCDDEWWISMLSTRHLIIICSFTTFHHTFVFFLRDKESRVSFWDKRLKKEIVVNLRVKTLRDAFCRRGFGLGSHFFIEAVATVSDDANLLNNSSSANIFNSRFLGFVFFITLVYWELWVECNEKRNILLNSLLCECKIKLKRTFHKKERTLYKRLKL